MERIQNGNDILSYTYDNIGNIETISENGELKATYHYDELNQLIREDNLYLNKSISYSYDTGGNILNVSEYAYTTGELGEVAAVKTYGYEDANWKDKLTSYNGQSITYDAIGNPLQYRDGMNFTWQNGRQLASVNDNTSYQYNAEGIRTQKTVNGVTTNYFLNGSTILSQVTGSDQMDFLYDEIGNLLGFSFNGEKYYYIRNIQSDVIGILDNGGNQVVSYIYDSWGSLISTNGSLANTIGVQNPFRYRGYYYDAELEMYYLNSRYYDPKIGRFINSDQIAGMFGTLSSRNAYTYCENDPINRYDPLGYFSICWANQEGYTPPLSFPKPEPVPTPQVKPTRPTNVSQKGQSLIKNYDSKPGSNGEPHLEAYYDIYGVKTIGWGYTAERRPELVPDSISKIEAEEFFQSDLKRMTDKANKIIINWDLTLTQNQYDAAVMYAFQHGPNGDGPKSLTALLKAIDSGSADDVRAILQGSGRREDEWELYNSGDYNRNH